ncbi:MAG: hypothetical protein IJJ15_03200 [Ruminococcus sp.]|nr:hypothetical protein [Ruminococcus sp.]
MAEDLNQKISQILSDPESMKELSQLASMLGEKEPGIHKEEPKAPDISSLLGAEHMGTLLKIAPMLGSLSKEDDTTRLLKAIRPFLSEERKHKLDEAEKMLKMMKLMPLLKDFSL